jgi:hypothetical protein
LKIGDHRHHRWEMDGEMTFAGMEGLSDEPGPGTSRKFTDAQVEAAVTRSLEECSGGSDALEYEKVSPAGRIEPKRHRANLARFWDTTSTQRDAQTVH